MQRLLTLLFIMAGLLSQPLFATTLIQDSNTVLVGEPGDGGGKPPAEEEEPDCE